MGDLLGVGLVALAQLVQAFLAFGLLVGGQALALEPLAQLVEASPCSAGSERGPISRRSQRGLKAWVRSASAWRPIRKVSRADCVSSSGPKAMAYAQASTIVVSAASQFWLTCSERK